MHRVAHDYSGLDLSNPNVKVFVRARPLEDSSASPANFVEVFPTDPRKLTIKDPDGNNNKYNEVTFQFDRVLWCPTPQEEVFEAVAKPQIDKVLRGFHSCCFAYGQTGSGKTHTMFGREEADMRGIVPRAAEYLFQAVSAGGSNTEFVIGCSFLEIYMDSIRDLGKACVARSKDDPEGTGVLSISIEKTSDLFNDIAKKRQDPYLARAFSKSMSQRVLNEKNPGLKEVQDEYDSMNLEIREDLEGNVFVKDLSIIPVTSVDEIMGMITLGMKMRATHETKMNAVSSRSHTVFTIHVAQKDKNSGEATSAMLNLVDLAGSERLKRSESQGQRLKEALHINSSLTTLGKVVMALDPSADMSHVPYRESKLTRLLQNSLGGNSYTVLLATIHPDPTYYDETMSTLQFANRCRNVRNNPRVNYVSGLDGQEDVTRKVKRLSEEVTALRQKLSKYEGTRFSPVTAEVVGGQQLDKKQMEVVFAHRFASLMKKIGLKCEIGTTGAINLGDGRQLTSDDLEQAIEEGNNAATTVLDLGNATDEAGGGGGDGANYAEGGNDGGANGPSYNSSNNGGGGGGNRSAGMSDAMKNKNRELMAEIQTLKDRLRERKEKMDNLERTNKTLDAEIKRLKGSVVHTQSDMTRKLSEVEATYKSLESNMKQKHETEIRQIVNQNTKLMSQSTATIQSMPKTLRLQADLAKQSESAQTEFDLTLRATFSKHLSELEEARVIEIDMLKQQYEYWLSKKDDLLASFVDKFNEYRDRKNANLKACEREMSEMLVHLERNDNVLRNVENGRYFMQYRHNSLPMTNDGLGVTTVMFPKGHVLTGNGIGGGTAPQQTAGNTNANNMTGGGQTMHRSESAKLPTQPKLTAINTQGSFQGSTFQPSPGPSMANNSVPIDLKANNTSAVTLRPPVEMYPLAARIRLKFKKRKEREEAMKDKALDAALNRFNGIQASGDGSGHGKSVDAELQNYVRDLLMSPSKSHLRIHKDKEETINHRMTMMNKSQFTLGSNSASFLDTNPQHMDNSKARPKSAAVMRHRATATAARQQQPATETATLRESSKVQIASSADEYAHIYDDDEHEDAELGAGGHNELQLKSEIAALQNEIERMRELQDAEKVSYTCMHKIK